MLDEAQAGIKIAEWNVTNLRYEDDTKFMAESEEELKSLLMKVKEDSWKVGLKLNIQKTKIMASGPITSWQINGEKMETVTDFIFLGSKITADDDCSHKIKIHLLLEKQAMTNVSSAIQSCLTLCELIDCSTPGVPFLHHLPVCSNSCPLSQWWHPTISSFIIPFSSCPQSFAASESFPLIWLLHQVAIILELYFQHQTFQ